jgi:HSP20 family protein
VARIFFERLERSDARRFAWSDAESSAGGQGGADTVPPMDVIETQENIEVVIDLPGVDPANVNIVVRDGVLLVSGVKRPATCQHGRAAFHLAERGFGTFARALRLTAAVDAGRASSSLVAGELRILLPRVDERRGREIRVPITTR